MFWHKGFQLRQQIARQRHKQLLQLWNCTYYSVCSQKCLDQLHDFQTFCRQVAGMYYRPREWLEKKKSKANSKARKCLRVQNSPPRPNEAVTTKTRISLKETWAANLRNKMKTALIMKSLLVLQQEAVPRESINNLVSREYEFYLPKRIRGTSFFFDVILSAQVSAYVWSSHTSLSRSASTPPEKLTSLAPSNSCST